MTSRAPSQLHRIATWSVTLCILAIGPIVAAQSVTEITISRGCSSDVYDSYGNCIDSPTPEERRLQAEKDKRERDRRERDRLMRDAKAAEFKRQVDAQVKILGGEHRRTEAERFVTMREAAKAARPNTVKSDQCKRDAYSHEWSTGGLTDSASVNAEYAGLRTKACQGRGGTVSPLKCSGIKVMGEKFASCTATISCAAYTYSCSSSRVTGQ